MRDVTAKWLSAAHAQVYRSTGGRIGRRLVDNDMLLLTTTGRRSGDEHTVPLLYLRDAEHVIVIASWGGRDYPPDWFANVENDDRVRVQIGSEQWTGTAAALEEPERSEWWERAVAAYDGYREYQGRTDRVIPVVRIIPA
ncbi:MAG: nitroreductase family deazaflavin-dependent oxidoreductase [Acidimicrobiia bacterium]|nr:nitroreductase family deazaflavin-dependent oxidoreductase [Acidimicrobiia bacterium]